MDHAVIQEVSNHMITCYMQNQLPNKYPAQITNKLQNLNKKVLKYLISFKEH